MQKRAIYTLGSGILLIAALAGCNNTGTTNYNDNASPLGYYSDEAINDDRTGLDNDGPITEMMDRNAKGYQTVPLTNEGVNLNKQNINRNSMSNSELSSGRLTEKIEQQVRKVKNVEDVRVLIQGNDVLIVLDTNGKNQRQIETEVKKTVRPLTKGRNVYVVKDKGTFLRIRDIDNDLFNRNQ